MGPADRSRRRQHTVRTLADAGAAVVLVLLLLFRSWLRLTTDPARDVLPRADRARVCGLRLSRYDYLLIRYDKCFYGLMSHRV